jgi:adenylate cyclase
VGDTVNLASRLQGLSKKVGEDIVVSESTKNRAADRFRFRTIAETGIRGKQAPVRIYTLA